ncbi:MAG: 4Fe-4S binding protein [Muribaculaceae bacterium]
MKDTRNRPVKVTKFLIATSSHDCIACWRCVKACPRDVLGQSVFYGIVMCVSVTPKIALVVVNVLQCVLKRYSL